MPRRVLDAAYMESVSKGFQTVFNDALNTQNSDYLKIATDIHANTVTVDYSWLADMPSMREWVGDRTLNELAAWNYTISKKDWEASIKVKRDVIEYDNLGIVKPRIIDLAAAVPEHYNSMVFGLLESNGDCYDGKKFFAADHQVKGQNFSNLSNLELTEENYEKTVAEMGRLIKDNGNPLRIKPNLIVVPPELKAKAKELFLAEKKANGASNPLYKEVEILVCYELTKKKTWYLLDTSRAVKPIVLQKNKEAQFVAQDKPDDEAAFMRKEFRYGVDTEDNAGYGLWQMAYKNAPTE